MTNRHDTGFAARGHATAADAIAPEGAARLLEEAVRDAGAVALRMFRDGCRNWTKGENSPVTEADIAVDEMLRQRLLEATPGYGWESEESESLARPAHGRAWVIDPIDGTRSFVNGLNDWTISAALVERGRPVAAVLFAPATDEMFAASAGGGARRNGQPISAREAHSLDGLRIAGPRGTLGALARAGFDLHAVPRIHSLALRLTRVASGEVDAALASGRSHDWDLAAADLLVHEAGGRLTSADNAPLIYRGPHIEHPPLVASGSAIHQELRQALATVADLAR